MDFNFLIIQITGHQNTQYNFEANQIRLIEILLIALISRVKL